MSAPLENEDEAVRRAGDRAPHEQDVLLGIHAGDQEILRRERLAAHAARQALALDDARRIRGRADRSRLPAHRGSVRSVAAPELVTLDDAREAASLGRALHVHVLAFLEHRDVERLAERVGGHVRDSELPEVARRREVALLELPEHGLREATLLVRAETELERGVAVALPGADLRHGAWPRLDHGHGHDVALLVEELGHADLFSDQTHHLEIVLSRRRTPSSPPAPSLRDPRWARAPPSGLDLNVHTGRDVELLERFHGLPRRARDVDGPLVNADLGLLAGLLVHVWAPEHRVHGPAGRQLP